MSVRNEFQDGEGRAFRFPENDDMRIGLLDLQRASWAPMLGLDEQSTVLQGMKRIPLTKERKLVQNCGKFEEALL